MKTLCLFVLCSFVWTIQVLAQASPFIEEIAERAPNHLQPVEPRFDAYGRLLARRLRTAEGDCGEVVITPAFTGETCISIVSNASKQVSGKYGGHWMVPANEKEYGLLVKKAGRNLYYQSQRCWLVRAIAPVNIKTTSRPVSLDLAVAVQHAWSKMLFLTRYSRNSYHLIDGTLFQYSVFVRGIGFLNGETQNLTTGLPREMSMLALQLEDFATRKSKLTECELIGLIRAFEKRSPRSDEGIATRV